MVDIAVNSQNAPVEYLARRFLINHNITAMAKLAKGDTHRSPPILPATSALALAAFALLKLRTAQLAKLEAVGTDWDAYITEAETLADVALASVSASNNGYFPSAQRILDKLQKFAADNNGGDIPDPTELDADWATNKGASPVAATQTISQAKHIAVDIDLLSGVTNTESGTETLSVVSVDGENWELDREIVIGGVTYTMAASYHLTADAPADAVATTVVPVVITDGVTDPISRNLSITLTNTAPTADAIDVTDHVHNTPISYNFLTLSNAADANSDTVRVTEINGVDVPTPFAAGNYQFTVDGVVFTLAKATGLVTAAAQPGPDEFTGTFKVGDDDANDPKETAGLAWTITVLAE